ncbi:peptidase [Marinilabiliaceae bacterium JC017]|nr:peptidase [Marinilabiliaceae bacterium JC017]
MKKLSILLLLSLITTGIFAQKDFAHFFENKSLRVDFYLYGNDKETKGSIAQMKEEPFWGGPAKLLIEPYDQGTYRVQLFNKRDGKLLFSKGFNPLFMEWQTTNEAKTTTKMYYHAFQIPYPKGDMVFKVDRRNWEGQFENVLTQEIDPKNYFIIKEQAKQFDVTNLLLNGKSDEKIDIAILAEGYTKAEMGKFIADSKRMIDYLFTVPPFDRFKDQFNVYAIQSESEESGTDVPGEHIYKNTIFNSSFYTFDSPRYLTTSDMKAVADVASLVPYDQIYVLVNSATYGGGGFYNYINLTSVDHNLSEKVFVHEFGHGFVGLADEYYDSSTSYNEFYNLEIEPWEPNITTLVEFDKKWQDMLHKKTPVPTPRTSKYANTTGVFEGGGYSAKGIYSPAQDCRMKSNLPEGFCPVCERAIERVIKFLTDKEE